MKKLNWEIGGLGFLSEAADTFRIDQVSDAGVTKERRNGTYTMYQGLHRNYDASPRNAWDAYDDNGELEDLSKRVALYQGMNEAGGYLIRSSLGPIIMDSMRTLVNVREYVTLKVARREDGALRVTNNHQKNRFLELSISTSARRGIEPRLRLYDHLMFKYDVFDNATILEYNVNF